MADKNESFEFQIKANIKHLQDQLKKIPSMTKEEASKMVRALSSEMRKAQTAAKKAATESRKAAQQSAKAFKQSSKKVGESFKEQSKAAQKSANQIKNSFKSANSGIKNTRKQSRELAGAFGSLEDVVSEVSPELGGLATTVGTVGQGMRALSRSLATGNPLVLVLVGSVAVLAAAYHLLTASQREAERQQKLMEEATEKANEKFAVQAEIITKLNNTKVSSQRELLVITGQMTQLEKDIADARDASKESIQADLLKQREYIVEQQRILQLAKKAGDSKSSLNDEERKTLELALLQSKHARYRNALNASNITLGNLMLGFQKEVNTNISEQLKLASGIEHHHEKNLQARIQILELKSEEVESDKVLQDRAKAKAEKEANAAKAEAKRLQEKAKQDTENARIQHKDEAFERKIAKIKEQNFNSEISNMKTRIQMMDEGEGKNDALLKVESLILERKLKSIKAEKEANNALAETEKQKQLAKESNAELDLKIAQLKDGFHLKELQQSDERIEKLEKEKKTRLELANEIGGVYSEAAKATSNLIKTVAKEDQQAAIIAFRIAQTAALADIAMTTATKIMEVAPNPIAMTAVGAIGGIQAATVLAQSPPEFHMGGFISKGEDTRNITVLTGEAVLDRRTVERLGGQEGINRIQKSGIQRPEIVVMNPYKHFDRYASSSMKRGGILSKISSKSASGSY